VLRLARSALLGLLAATSLLAPPARAQGTPGAAAPDSVFAPPRSGWLYVLPVISYSPETRFAFGGSAGRFYRLSEEPDSRPSTVSPLFIVTTEGQLMAWLFGDAWWGADAWNLAGMLGYSKFPTQYYGTGDDTPASAEEDVTPATFRTELDLKHRLASAFYLGVRLEVEQARVLEAEAGGQVDQGLVYGHQAGGLFGLGASASWDTRDFLFYPTRGWYHQLSATRYLDALGGDYVYTRTVADLRRYVSLGGSRVLALQAMGTFTSGGRAPFYHLAPLGLRGYFETRYLENHAVQGQVELRTVVWRWLGAVAFAGLGELGPTVAGLRLDEARPSYGLGLRFRVGGEGPDRTHIRLDFGFGEDDSAVYVNFAEAF